MTAKRNTMSEKIAIKTRDQEMASRIVGTVFIIVGTILVGLGIYSFLTYKAEPELDTALEVPVLEEIEDVTNSKEISLKGSAKGLSKVRIFVNDVLLETLKVEDEKFEYDWELEDEGIYTISLDGLKGFPRQKRSEASDIKFVTVDWTAPSKDISLEYPTEVVKKSFRVEGSIDPNTKLFVKRGTKEFEGMSDSDGNIEMVIDLEDEGKNVFGMLLRDEAGNETTLEEKIRITYSPRAGINGDGIQGISDEIPEASGELSKALMDIFANRLMMLFGLLAIVAMSTTTILLVRKNREVV